MSVNVSVTITGSYPQYLVTFSDGGVERVAYNTSVNIVYGFASGTTGFTFVGVVDVVKTPSTTQDTISWKVSSSQLTVTAVNKDTSASRIDYRIQFRDSQGRLFLSSDPQVDNEGEPQ
jgi:hypothetical protein